MRYKEQIFQSASLVIFLGCSCFAIYLVFLLASYSSAIARMERRFEERTFPKMTEMIDQRINLFFNPSLQGLTLLADNLDWRTIMEDAVSNPGGLHSRMKVWTAQLGASSVGVSDRDRRIVWDYWSSKSITLHPGLSRDKWFFDFWTRKKIPDWSFALYAEHSADNYQLYIDRLIRNGSGRPIGSIAAKIPLMRLREELSRIIGAHERVIILDDRANVIIDVSRMKTGDGVLTFTMKDSGVQRSVSAGIDPLISTIIAQDRENGRIETGNEKIFFRRTTLFDGALSILSFMNGDIYLQREKSGLKKELIVLFASFTLFIGGILLTMMLYTQRVKLLAAKLETEKTKFEDLLFIITHGLGNEILQLRKHIKGVPRRFSSGIDARLSEIGLMIQNSVNVARLGNGKELIIAKPYSFSWQWKKLTEKFEKLSKTKGQTFSASSSPECVIVNDEEMVYQILSNLVSNAVKYAPGDGKIGLNAWTEKDTLCITIRDSGPGFLPEDISGMFLKYGKLSARPTGGERSTGLGLYIVKQLADACNITLGVSCGEGELCGALWKLELKTAHSGT